MPEDSLLTIPEVAERLHVSPQTVGQLLRVGLLPAIKLGRIWRVAPTDLDDFIAEARRTGSVPKAWPGRADRTPKGGPRRRRVAQ